jgi:hypothetical protein
LEWRVSKVCLNAPCIEKTMHLYGAKMAQKMVQKVSKLVRFYRRYHLVKPIKSIA